MDFNSWGQVATLFHDEMFFSTRNDSFPTISNTGQTILPVGKARSYGDVCTNHNHVILHCSTLNKFIRWSEKEAVLECESGVTLHQILTYFVPKGWFLKITPGTKFVTLGGAIANDIHGKNHHTAGNFSRSVISFELLRSDNSRICCSRAENQDLFYATIGGLGLTGIITKVSLKLLPISSRTIYTLVQRFQSLEEFFDLSQEYTSEWNYTVSWLDCVGSGRRFGRGIFMAGRHLEGQEVFHSRYQSSVNNSGAPKISIPVSLPLIVMNKYLIKAFNELYFHVCSRKKALYKKSDYEPFFYPLDSIGAWNRLYGRKGFYQFQCVIPEREGIRKLLKKIVEAGTGSFLAVLKEFGTIPSEGMISFPKQGTTLALDFQNHGQKTVTMLLQFEKIVREYGGSIYPAKDAIMTREAFHEFYPQFEKFIHFKDPLISSDFLRRVS
jgi:FAD/FMN-containing dehydrogenase